MLFRSRRVVDGIPGPSRTGRIVGTDQGQRPPRRPWGPILAAALVLTAATVCKPIHIDDAAVVQYARQAWRQPLDPYGFSVFWADRPQPAYEQVVPPGFPYWVSLAMRAFGEHPVAWKAFLFPVALVFAASLDFLQIGRAHV